MVFQEVCLMVMEALKVRCAGGSAFLMLQADKIVDFAISKGESCTFSFICESF